MFTPVGPSFLPQPFPAFPVYYHQIYVGDIPITFSRDQIYDYFRNYGNIMFLKIGRNKKSKQFAFVSYDSPEAGYFLFILPFNFSPFLFKKVERALKNANNTKIDGVLLRVDNVRNMRQYSLEGNLFFKSAPLDLTNDEIKNLFSQFGKVASCKLVCQEDRSLGLGYVQYENKESADKCLNTEQDNPVKQLGIEVVRFIPRSNRETRKNNLYVKFPQDFTKEDLPQLKTMIEVR